ncbi:hypothetical protein TK90_2676 (plasmid) [Thioalkalivibrio sp. K90mix]|nr:hypothetical protein TK90_2676 [Thioalkalivibrio sp. K90mix]
MHYTKGPYGVLLDVDMPPNTWDSRIHRSLDAIPTLAFVHRPTLVTREEVSKGQILHAAKNPLDVEKITPIVDGDEDFDGLIWLVDPEQAHQLERIRSLLHYGQISRFPDQDAWMVSPAVDPSGVTGPIRAPTPSHVMDALEYMKENFSNLEPQSGQDQRLWRLVRAFAIEASVFHSDTQDASESTETVVPMEAQWIERDRQACPSRALF